MRNHQIIAVAAGREDAEISRLQTKLFLAPLAHRAFAAAHPRMHEPAISDLYALGIGTMRDDFTDIFVPHGERQFNAAVLEHQPFAVADLIIAVPDMQVAVTHTGGDHFK